MLKKLIHNAKILFGIIVIAFIINNYIRVGNSGIIIYYIQTHGIVSVSLWLLGIMFAVDIALSISSFWKNNPSTMFWKLVCRNPDEAYSCFSSSSNWKMLNHKLLADFQDEFPKTEWAGPFDLYVPLIQSHICLFCRSESYKDEQNKFIQMMKK
jgi:hypothetical protein